MGIVKLPFNFAGAGIHKTNFRGANLTGANLERANISFADFSDTILRGARLKGTIMKGTNLRGADLTGALDLTREQLAEAVIDRRTTLPDYLAAENRPPQ